MRRVVVIKEAPTAPHRGVCRLPNAFTKGAVVKQPHTRHETRMQFYPTGTLLEDAAKDDTDIRVRLNPSAGSRGTPCTFVNYVTTLANSPCVLVNQVSVGKVSKVPPPLPLATLTYSPGCLGLSLTPLCPQVIVHFASYQPNSDPRFAVTVPKSELGPGFQLSHLYDKEMRDDLRMVAFMERLRRVLTNNLNADLKSQCVTIALPSAIFTDKELKMYVFRACDGSDVNVDREKREVRTPNRGLRSDHKSRGGSRSRANVGVMCGAIL